MNGSINLHFGRLLADPGTNALHHIFWKLLAQDLHYRGNLLVPLVKLVLNILLGCSVPKTALLGGNLILQSLFGLLAVGGFDLVLELLDLGMSALGVGFEAAHVLELLRASTASLAQDSLLLGLISGGTGAGVVGGAGHGGLAHARKVVILTRVTCHDCAELARLGRNLGEHGRLWALGHVGVGDKFLLHYRRHHLERLRLLAVLQNDGTDG